MIKLKNVTYTYPGTSQPALRDISLEIPDGMFLAIVGPNDAGKSTLAYTIGGYVPHFFHGNLIGVVTVDGKETVTTPLSELAIEIGLIFQNPFNQISGTKFTVQEEVAFGLENLGLPRQEILARVGETLELVGISELAKRSPLSLSGGEMQRVAIASILVMKPRILVLDEPTSQLDPLGSQQVFSALQNMKTAEQMTIVVIEHKLEWLATFADRVIALASGIIVGDGKPNEILTDETIITHGIGQTRYTMAARRVRQLARGFPSKKLPVTLDEAVETFQAMMTQDR